MGPTDHRRPSRRGVEAGIDDRCRCTGTPVPAVRVRGSSGFADAALKVGAGRPVQVPSFGRSADEFVEQGESGSRPVDLGHGDGPVDSHDRCRPARLRACGRARRSAASRCRRTSAQVRAGRRSPPGSGTRRAARGAAPTRPARAASAIASWSHRERSWSASSTISPSASSRARAARRSPASAPAVRRTPPRRASARRARGRGGSPRRRGRHARRARRRERGGRR